MLIRIRFRRDYYERGEVMMGDVQSLYFHTEEAARRHWDALEELYTMIDPRP